MSKKHRREIERILDKEPLESADLESLPFAAMIMNKARTVLAANQAALDLGVKIGTPCWDSFGKCASIPQGDKHYYEQYQRPPIEGTKCYFCLADQALSSQVEQNTLVTADKNCWDTYWIPKSKDQYLHFAVAHSDDQTHSQS